MRLRRLILAVWMVAVTTLGAPAAFGQATVSYAQLSGTILDPSGQVIAGASITLRDQATNRTYTCLLYTSRCV